MRRKVLLMIVVVCASVAFAQSVDSTSVEEQYVHLLRAQEQTAKELRSLRHTTTTLRKQVHTLSAENVSLRMATDSLQTECSSLRAQLAAERDSLSSQIAATNSTALSTRSAVAQRTTGGVVLIAIIVVLILAVAYYLLRRLRSGSSTLDAVRAAQETLLTAQTKLQEGALRLDNKLLALLEQQMTVMPSPAETTDPENVDHSLALKVADEIVRIETNLSRMDSTIKGHKQLSKAVARIRDNFLANGYEIVEMLGKPYDDGMKAIASYTPDDSLPAGAQIITGISKPQVNYNGKMIQAAQITVSQNI